MQTKFSLLGLAGVGFFGFAALLAIRLALADTISRQDNPTAVARAIALQWPARSAELELTLAEMQPAHARESLERAVADNPQSSEAWITLGLRAEAESDFARAEECLERAARVDHQYLPAWTLANYYFRRDNREKFWKWANRSAALAYDGFQPLLRLGDQFEPDPARLIAHFDGARRMLPSYLNFLIGENRLDAAQRVARTMLDERRNDSYLIDLADRQLRARNAGAAIELWNAASGFPVIDPSNGRILTNGNLARPPLNLGFDWLVARTDGITQKWRPSELIFSFSGAQPETCSILEQTIYLAAGHFRLRFDYTTGDKPTTGIHWSLDNMEGPLVDPSSGWKEGAFDLPGSPGLRNLKLVYRREPGTTRTEGRIEVRNLRVEAS